MSIVPHYPQPLEDEDNRPFLEGWRSGRLFLQQSRQGGPLFFYPRPICPYSGSRDLIWKEVSGKGWIVSYSLVMRPNDPSFNDEVPIILAEIELEEGASLLGRLVHADVAKVKRGASVELLPPSQAVRYPLPAFQLAEARWITNRQRAETPPSA